LGVVTKGRLTRFGKAMTESRVDLPITVTSRILIWRHLQAKQRIIPERADTKNLCNEVILQYFISELIINYVFLKYIHLVLNVIQA
jgi:hypothetical protein